MTLFETRDRWLKNSTYKHGRPWVLQYESQKLGLQESLVVLDIHYTTFIPWFMYYHKRWYTSTTGTFLYDDHCFLYLERLNVRSQSDVPLATPPLAFPQTYGSVSTKPNTRAPHAYAYTSKTNKSMETIKISSAFTPL
jgi:hypothetical protein